MSTFIKIELIFLSVLIVWLLFLLVRNGQIFKVRMAFIDSPELYPDAYNRLPTYSKMCDHPKHYLRWTTRQWIEYAEAT
ncbi:hypothetical protein PQR71_42095 [Paraburkholderia fungorum]|uniref:hypothetical protein n=1 Tax=Paraburkholderia fungorum TaxID=134537 RepID=UPI0038BA5075